MLRNPRFSRRNQAFVLCLLLMSLILSGSACRLFTSASPSPPAETSPSQEATRTQDRPDQPGPETPLVQNTPVGESPPLRQQWSVSAVDASSSEEAAFTTGAPNAEGCELMPLDSVWVFQADPPPTATTYLQLFYAEPVLPHAVEIHLAYTFSAITEVSLIDLQGRAHLIHEDLPKNLADCPVTLTLPAEGIDFPVYAVRIDLAAVAPEPFGLTAIDAVALVGEPLPEPQPTPIPTPYLTMSSLGFNAADVQEGFFHFEVIDNNTDETLSTTECNAFSFNLDDTARTLRFFSCEDQTEVWLYAPLSLDVGSVPLNSYPLIPSARLFFNGRYIPAMEGELWIDRISSAHITGVLEFKGFDPENQAGYYRVAAVFNQIPLTEEAAQQPGDMIPQWGQTAEASSERSTNAHAAFQAAGSSDTWEACEGAITTWKPAETDPQPWIEIYFQQPVAPSALNILFAGKPEAFLEVNFLSEADYFPLDLSTARVLEGCPQVFVFDSFQLPPINILGIQILLDPEAAGDTFGIDAVQLIGVIG